MSTEDLISLKNSNSIVCIQTTRIPSFGGSGSGFFVKPDMIVTNIHGIALRSPVFVRSVDKKTTWKVEGVAAFDVKNDLVVLKVSGESTPLPLGNSDVVQSGEPISVVGFPDSKYEVTEGTVHSIRESDKLIRMNVNTSYGSSGSAVLNDKRQVIGIVVGSSSLYGHAIPSSPLKALLDQAEIAEPLVKWRKRKPVRSYAKYAQGEQHYRKKRYRKAIVEFDKATKLNTELVWNYFERGGAKAKLGDVEGAIADYNKVIQLNSDHLGAYNNRGLAKAELGDHEGAIADYDKIIQLNADDFPAYCNRGLAKAKLGDVEGAITDYDRAIQLNADDFVAYNNRGLAKVELGDVEGAIADYDKAVALNPKVERVYFNRARAYASYENYEAAITDYDKAIKLKPKDAKVYFNRALAKEALGQQDAAKADFDKAKELE